MNNRQQPNPEQMAATAQRYSSLRGVDPDKVSLIPKRGASAEAYADTLQRLGAPKDASAYTAVLAKIEGLPPELVEWGAQTAAKANVFPWQAAHVAESFAKESQAAGQAAIEDEQAAAAEEMSALRDEWGPKYVVNVEVARRALRYAEQRGHNARDVLNYLESAAGPAAAIKVLAFYGARTMEGDFIDGEITSAQTRGKTLLERMYPNES